MAETSLRAYVREIDDLVEQEQLDEAIAHARHILQTYPRHLDTYRLLGKAYLEAKRYGDSADILQRVLSAVPDDFVANVGMAIVREDEGNIDAAIWHMERAFETNPSNAAVQGELRRLLGRRDGLEPHKVRLTRGALARMYAHGELYPQAIAELRAALSEDPDRPDLQVLLAEMYWRTNQRAEAAEVASAVLESLPNCREANRIMAAALHAQRRTEEALTYHRRVAALDPYSALVETIQEDAASVEPNAVRIEKLIWQPGQPLGRDTGPSAWASGVAGETRASSSAAARPAPPRPSWLDSLGAEAAASAAAAAAAAEREEELAAPPPASTAVSTERAVPSGDRPVAPIPDWIQAAGWTPGTGGTAEEPISFSDSELQSLEAGMLPPDAAPEPEGGLARADIPDWLKNVAPPEAEADDFEALPQESAASEGLAGLDEPRLPPGWTPPPAGSEGDEDDWLKAAAEEAPAVPTWMEEQSPGATATIVTWLGDRPRQETPLPARPAAEAPTSASVPEEALPEPADLPMWLSDQAPSAAAEAGPSPVSGPPAWLSGVAEAAALGSTLAPDEVSWEPGTPEEPIQTGMYPESEAPAQPGELPEWLQTIAGTESASRIRARGEATPEWLQPGPPREAKPAPASAEAGSESFGWLRQLAESEPPTPSSGAAEGPPPSWLAEPAPGSRATLGRSAGPEWLRGIAEPEPSGAEDTSSMDWLRGIAEAPVEEPAAPTTDDEAAQWVNLVGSAAQSDDSTTGEWLRLLKEEGVPSPEPEAGPPVVAAVAVAAAPPAGEIDDAQVFDWLETLAAKQGIPAPEAITETPAAAPPAAQVPAVPRVETAMPIPEEPDAGLKWLEDLAAEQAPAPVAVPAPPVAPAVTPPALVPPLALPVALAKSTRLAEPAAPPSEPSPQVPDWLKQLVAETPAAEATPQDTGLPAAETWPALPEWMVTAQPAEDEPTVPPLPPVAAARLEAEFMPAEPIDELADTWVPPWEQLPEEAPPAALAVSPTDDTVVRRPPRALAETPERIPAAEVPSAAGEVAEAEPVAAAPARYKEPTTDILEEVPDWLRTPAPYHAKAPEVPPEPEPVREAKREEEFDVPDWLVAPIPAIAAVEPVAPAVASIPAAPVAPPMPIQLVAMIAPVPAPAPAVTPVEIVPPAPPAVAPAPAAAEPAMAERRAEPVPAPLPPAAPSRKPPVRAPKPKAESPGLEDKLVDARHALAVGDYRRAASGYTALIKRKYQLDEVTSELELALDRNPKAAPLWQVLGDAYMKNDRLPDAITAYERGIAAA